MGRRRETERWLEILDGARNEKNTVGVLRRDVLVGQDEPSDAAQPDLIDDVDFLPLCFCTCEAGGVAR